MLRIDMWGWTKGKTLVFQSPAVSRRGPDSSRRQRTPLKLWIFTLLQYTGSTEFMQLSPLNTTERTLPTHLWVEES